MDGINLIEIIDDAQTLVEAFNNLKGMEIVIERNMESSYIPIETRKEFVILEANIEHNKGTQFLHPYGANISYKVSNFFRKKSSQR